MSWIDTLSGSASPRIVVAGGGGARDLGVVDFRVDADTELSAASNSSRYSSASGAYGRSNSSWRYFRNPSCPTPQREKKYLRRFSWTRLNFYQPPDG
jgi:hypothetical protein